MSRILLVEDDFKLARFIELELVHEGMEVEKAHDGRTGAQRALSGEFDLVLLDLMLPGLSGMEVLRRVRRELDIPVIVLTARDAVMDKVAGLDAGADDYVTKPFAIEELLARIRVALKRRERDGVADGRTASGDMLEVGDVALSVERHEVWVGGELVELTQREFEILRVLMENRDIVMSRTRLAELALGYDYIGTSNVVDVHVRHLRAKIDERLETPFVRTVRGVGYVVRQER